MNKTVQSRPLPTRRASQPAVDQLPPPLVWTFDGSFAHCLADTEDALRRAIVMVGDVARVAVLIELSLDNIARYGLSDVPRVRHVRAAGPLVTLVFAYRS